MEPELVNGNWIQTNAYLLQSIKEIITNYTGDTVNVNVQPTDVVLQQNIYLPQEIKFVSNLLPIVIPPSKAKVFVNYIRPEPKVIDVSKENAYSRVCGNGSGSNYQQCRECVDKWLEANKDGFELKNLTSTGTGCSSKSKPKYSKISPEPIPYISCCERKQIAKAIEYEKNKEAIENASKGPGMRIFNINSQEYKDYLDSLNQ